MHYANQTKRICKQCNRQIQQNLFIFSLVCRLAHYATPTNTNPFVKQTQFSNKQASNQTRTNPWPFKVSKNEQVSAWSTEHKLKKTYLTDSEYQLSTWNNKSTNFRIVCPCFSNHFYLHFHFIDRVFSKRDARFFLNLKKNDHSKNWNCHFDVEILSVRDQIRNLLPDW